jgi:hypothetical protein
MSKYSRVAGISEADYYDVNGHIVVVGYSRFDYKSDYKNKIFYWSVTVDSKYYKWFQSDSEIENDFENKLEQILDEIANI